MITGHGGDLIGAAEELGCGPDELLDFSTSVNALGPSSLVKQSLQSATDDLARYPDPHCRSVRDKLARRFDVSPDQVLVTAGATELLYLIPRVLRPRRVSLLAPCYPDYWLATAAVDAEIEGLMAPADNEFRHKVEHIRSRVEVADMVILGQPNNPTGTMMAREDILQLAARAPHARFVVDETFVDFSPDPDGQSLLGVPLPPNVIVVRSATAFFALPGLRLGFAVADAELIDLLEREKKPWTMSTPALRAAEVLYDDEAYIARSRSLIAEQRAVLSQEFAALPGIDAVPSAANFHLLHIRKKGLSSRELQARMMRERVLIRDCRNFRGLDGRFVRAAIRTEPENRRFLAALHAAMTEA